jgi:hypothetical protein
MEKLERDKIHEKHFLSPSEWGKVDEKIGQIARYSNAKFYKAVRGDSFAALAVRQNSFKVATILLQKGVDPLLDNEESDDLFEVTKKQYKILNERLKEIENFKILANNNIILPSIINDKIEFEIKLLELYEELVLFIEDFKVNLIKRINEITEDKLLEKKLNLLQQV